MKVKPNENLGRPDRTDVSSPLKPTQDPISDPMEEKKPYAGAPAKGKDRGTTATGKTGIPHNRMHYTYNYFAPLPAQQTPRTLHRSPPRAP